MVQGLSGLDSLGSIAKSDAPNDFDSLCYLFWDKGIGFSELMAMPIPYVLGIIKAHSYVKKEEEKAYKRAKRK
jgi:hypothetical protein